MPILTDMNTPLGNPQMYRSLPLTQREELAMHSRDPVALMHLASDRHAHVAAFAIANPACPLVGALAGLDHPDPLPRSVAVAHPQMLEELVWVALEEDPAELVFDVAIDVLGPDGLRVLTSSPQPHDRALASKVLARLLQRDDTYTSDVTAIRAYGRT